MSFLGQMVAEYSDSLTEDVNEELFDRRLGKQIYEFIIDDLKSFEMIPGVYLKDVEYITDPSKLDVRLNRNNIKSKKILKQKIEKLIPIQHTAFDALKFKIQINGYKDKDTGVNYVENTILIPKYVDRYHFLVNGNKTLVMFQVVDNAIYNHKGDVILSTHIRAKFSKDTKKKVPLLDVTTGEIIKVDAMIINLFKKTFNPMHYFVAKMGILDTISYFGYSKFCDIVTEVKDADTYHYFKINSNIMIQAERMLFESDGFFRIFIGMLIGMFKKDRIDTLYDPEVWVKRLGAQFTRSANSQLNKGYDVLRSFKNVLDTTTNNILRIDDHDKIDTYAVTRWVLREFDYLRNIDNNDLQNRRIRSNEYIASYFGKILKYKLNYVLNLSNPEPMSIARQFRFDEYSLFKSLFGGANACPLFRYNVDVNDLQALNGLKFSITGEQGLRSDRITNEQRDVYPSHLGRFELNAISPSSPGASGMLTPFCKIYDGGYFGSSESVAKGNYEKKFKKKVAKIKARDGGDYFLRLKANRLASKNFHERRVWASKYSEYRNEEGYIQLVRPRHVRNEDGYIRLTMKPRFIPYIRDANGYIKLRLINDMRPRLVFRPEYLEDKAARSEQK